jgi:AmmeMemoRadiSam system protein A
MELTADQGRILLDFARQTICSTLGRKLPEVVIPSNDPALRQPAGCFVTLHTQGTHRLRGCIGRLDTKSELLAAVQHAAVNVLNDPRFASMPVCLHELPELEIEITVIFPLRSAENCLDFQLLNEGIYLTIGDRSGCFLPQVARETGWSREQLLNRLSSEKLGLPANAWQNPKAKLMKFDTLLVGPEPFAG